MSRFQQCSVWVCLLLWGGVHGLQLEHAVVHHMAEAMGHVHCAHHSNSVEEEAEWTWDHEAAGVRPSSECALCDWTAVPSMACEANPLPQPFVVPRCPADLGQPCLGWPTPAFEAGMGRRGPPVKDFS